MNDETQRIAGGILAHTAMLNALIAVHPRKDALQGAWKQFRERGYSAALGLPGEFLEAFQEVADQIETQIRISGGTMKPD
jgi:hypothetical protein